MAATDQNYRSQKTLNLVFAVSCVLMFLSILWMLWDDYKREFKAVQREFRDVETQLSLAQMLENMPNEAALEKAENLVVELRKQRDDKLKELTAEHRDKIARRDRAEATYQKWKADKDAVSSYREIAADNLAAARTPEGRKDAQATLEARDKQLAEIKTKADEAERAFEEARLEVEKYITSEMKPYEQALADAEDDLKQISGTFDRFAKLAAEKRWKFGDTFRNLPIIDGFAAATRIDQTVLRDLPIDYGGFMDVTRYDRCATCHLAIDRGIYDRKSLLALADDQRVDKLQERLDTARRVLKERVKKGEKIGFDPDDLPKKVRAIKLTDAQIKQFGAHPRLDLFVDGNSAHPREKFGCTICHGGQGSATDFMYASHTPNDTVQEKRWKGGSGKGGHHWHANHDWDFPMQPKRFVESGCVKCHHQMTDLIRYGSKDEAPKLLEGYNLVRENGCFGCHEIAGMQRGRSIGPDLRLEPTPPLEWLPPREQRALKADTLNPPGTLRKVGPSLRRLSDKIGPKVNDWLLSWLNNPRHFRPDTKMPRFYGLSTNSKDALPDSQKAYPDAEIRSIAHYLVTESNKALAGEDSTRAAVRQDMERLHRKLKRLHGITGNEEKRPKKSELARLKRELPRDRKALDKLTVRYRDLSLLSRPTHAKEINDLIEELQARHEELYDLKLGAAGAEKAFAAIEGKGILAQIRKASEPRPIVARAKELIGEDGRPFPVNKVPAPNAEDAGKVGRKLFKEKGCLACHSHSGAAVRRFEDGRPSQEKILGDAHFGPELSRIANKLARGKNGRLWLIQWVLNPNVHHPRTRMPVTHLSVKEAAAIADWLLSQKDPDWKPSKVTTPKSETLRELARISLLKAPVIGRQFANDVIAKGLSKDQIKALPADADEQALVVRNEKGEAIYKAGAIDDDRLMRYVGKKAIGRLGCFGCHDVPGFESAKPIGTLLNDWGKKDPARLAFDDATSFVKEHFNIVERRDDEKNPKKRATEWKSTKDGKPPYEEFFFDSLKHHQREGFLHLKLQNPRSYDFNRVRNWEDRLRMPQFRFARMHQRFDKKGEPEGIDAYKTRRQREQDGKYDAQARFEEAKAREALMTFILGLVADPIPLKFVARPKGDRLAEVRGRHVLEKFNCAGCHELRAGTYAFTLPAKRKARADLLDDFERTNNPQDIVFPESNAWTGRPSPLPGHLFAYGVSPDDGPVLRTLDNKGVYRIKLAEALRYRDSKGLVRNVRAGEDISIPAGDMRSESPLYGGYLSHLLGAHLKKADDNRYGTPDKWRAALPPPLLREGERVQPPWLYKFLREPFKVRPYTVLRMPRFNMSEDEAHALVEYFSAVDRLNNPGLGLTEAFLKIPQQDERFWQEKSAEYLKRLKAKNPKHEKALLGQLALVWKRELADRMTRMQREREGIEAALKAAPKADKDKLKGNLDALDKKLKALKKLQGDADKLGKDDFKSKSFDTFVKEWREDGAYAADAYRLVTDSKSICMTCHSAGVVKSGDEKGPDLALGFERLRPKWTGQWIANPKRLSTYPPYMPQNFIQGQKVEPFLFQGDARQHALATRDVLMNLPWAANLPVNRYRLAPKGGQ